MATECQCGSADRTSCSGQNERQDLTPVGSRIYLTVGSGGALTDTPDNCTCGKIDCLYDILKLDSFLDAVMSNHVSRRASIRQGSGLIVTAMEAFMPRSGSSCKLNRSGGQFTYRGDRYSHGTAELHNEQAASAALTFLQVSQDNGDFFAHFPVVFGEVCAARGISLDACLQMYLFGTLRTVLSAAVRQGITGPYEGQRMQSQCQSLIPKLIQEHSLLSPEDAYVSFPLVDIMQSSHDHFFSKMFYS
eukprot:GHVS01105052.1.p1 GENE.GHVS01105052.1~~GHVS01105052.1.p1  ORF type:complete len:247 (-),score=13.19 GHVS01105052.1:123-863(-)